MKYIKFLLLTLCFTTGIAQSADFGKGKFTNAGNLHWLMNSEGAVFIRTNNVGGEPYARYIAEQCSMGRTIKIVTGIAAYVAPSVEKACRVFRSGHPQASPAQDTMIISGNTLIVNGDLYSVAGPEVTHEYEFMRHLSISDF